MKEKQEREEAEQKRQHLKQQERYVSGEVRNETVETFGYRNIFAPITAQQNVATEEETTAPAAARRTDDKEERERGGDRFGRRGSRDKEREVGVTKGLAGE